MDEEAAHLNFRPIRLILLLRNLFVIKVSFLIVVILKPMLYTYTRIKSEFSTNRTQTISFFPKLIYPLPRNFTFKMCELIMDKFSAVGLHLVFLQPLLKDESNLPRQSPMLIIGNLFELCMGLIIHVKCVSDIFRHRVTFLSFQ